MLKTMKRISITMLLTLCGATALAAQSGSGVDENSRAYIFAGFGRPSGEPTGFKLTYGGAGAEGTWDSGFGVGFEGGGSRGVTALTPAVFFSGSFLYRSPAIVERISLFVNLGATVAGGYEIISGSNAGLHFGGGLNYWFRDNVALRLEQRAYRFKHCNGCTVNTFRIGISFPIDPAAIFQ